MREIIQGEYYHILNRGNNKQNIFKDDKDRIRFLFSIFFFQSSKKNNNISRELNKFVQHSMLNISEEMVRELCEERLVELVAFVLMPNHFHLIVRELEPGGVSKYMQKISNSYTKYINTKNETSGHLFQGTFKSVHIKDNPQFLYVSAYIHNNVRELKGWNGKEHLYPWSSFQDFIRENRWGELLKTDIILNQFSEKDNKEKYKSFVQKSGAKDSCSTFDVEH